MFTFGEAWQKEVDEALGALNKRFPELSWLRCRNNQFFVRMWPDSRFGDDGNEIVNGACRGEA